VAHPGLQHHEKDQPAPKKELAIRSASVGVVGQLQVVASVGVVGQLQVVEVQR